MSAEYKYSEKMRFFNWFHHLVRRYTKPIPEQKAEFWKRRLSLVYAFAAWNALAIICYHIYTGKKNYAEYKGHRLEESGESPAQQWSKTLGIKDATVYRIQGFKVNRYEVHNDFEVEEKKKEEGGEKEKKNEPAT